MGLDVTGDGQGFDEREDVEIIDLDGKIIAPGLIDIQINGAFGVDFSEWNGDEVQYRKGVERVARGLLQTGVTSFVPTIIVSTWVPHLLFLRHAPLPSYSNSLKHLKLIAPFSPSSIPLLPLALPLLSPQRLIS